MIDVIAKAAENFCIHQIRLPYEISDDLCKTRTVIAYIDTELDDSDKKRIYIAYDEKMVQLIAEIFLGEDQSDNETLIDMALETVNMIVGSAKVLAAKEKGINFKIETPHFEKTDIFDLSCEHTRLIRVAGHEMMIATKEQD